MEIEVLGGVEIVGALRGVVDGGDCLIERR